MENKVSGYKNYCRRMNMNKNYIGEKNKNTFGTEMIIVEFNNKSYITVEFQD